MRHELQKLIECEKISEVTKNRAKSTSADVDFAEIFGLKLATRELNGKTMDYE